MRTAFLLLLLCVLSIPAFADEKTYLAELKAIAMIETSGGINLNHPVIKRGMHKGTKASGHFGLMPLTIRDLVSKSKRLNQRYSYLLDMTNDEITAAINTDSRMDREIALTFWKQLRKRFDASQAAYAWLYGPGKLSQVTSEDVSESEYVQKFKEYLVPKSNTHAIAQNP